MRTLCNTPGRLVSVLAAASIAVAGCTAGSRGTGTQRSATITRGPIAAAVSATGNVASEAEIRLSFQVSGTAADVRIKNGDRVRKGDVLAVLDLVDLQIAQQQAETAVAAADVAIANAASSVMVASAGYSRTVEGSRQVDIDAAQAAYNAAWQSYSKVKAGPLEEDYAAVQAAFLNAEAALKQAQANYDREFKRNPAGVGGSAQSLALEQATNNFNSAKAQLAKVAKPADDALVSAAVQGLQAARAGLERAMQPARQFDIDQADALRMQAAAMLKQAQIQKQQAELGLKQARRRIEQATLTAPTDGIISNLTLKVGEAVGTAPVATLVDVSLLHVDVTVDEIDIARVRAGQDVAVTLDALPGKLITARVDRVSPTSRLVNGVVSYDVRVLLPKDDPDLRVGMTSSASITLDRRENALLAPNWAVRRDRKAGKNYLTLREGDRTREIEVQAGLRNDQFTEIISGISEGQVVVAPETTAVAGQ